MMSLGASPIQNFANECEHPLFIEGFWQYGSLPTVVFQFQDRRGRIPSNKYGLQPGLPLAQTRHELLT